MIQLKSQKGITLVALILTAVILMILAIITISTIDNTGVAEKSDNIVSKFENQEIKEEIYFNEYNNYLDNELDIDESRGNISDLGEWENLKSVNITVNNNSSNKINITYINSSINQQTSQIEAYSSVTLTVLLYSNLTIDASIPVKVDNSTFNYKNNKVNINNSNGGYINIKDDNI